MAAVDLLASVAVTAAETLPSARRSCAAALEPMASMNRPMTAAAARPPRSFTKICLPLSLAGKDARWRRRVGACTLQRGPPRLASHRETSLGAHRSQLLEPRYEKDPASPSVRR